MTASPTILVVDDDRDIRTITRAFLSAAGFTVVDAASGPEALEIFNQCQSITLIISDVVMPGMSGPELCDRLLHIQPRLKVLFMSGYIECADLGGIKLLQKPFHAHELIGEVRALVDSQPRSTHTAQ